MSDQDRFWALAEPLLKKDGVEKSTMMGFPCLRRNGAFFACVHHKTGDLVIKVSKAERDALVESGNAEPFAPGGRTFKEWALIPTSFDDAVWEQRLEQAYAFAG